MSYFLRTSSETQKRLSAVLNKRKEDEEKLRPLPPVGGPADASNINSPTDFSGSLPSAESIFRGDLSVLQSDSRQYRGQSTREWRIPPGVDPDYPEGVPRSTDAQVADEPGAAERIESGQPRSLATLADPPLDMQQAKLLHPFEARELEVKLGLANSDTGMPNPLAPTERYGELKAIQGANVAGNNPDLLTAGSHSTPVGQVPIIPGHPNTIVLTPEEANNGILVERLATEGTQGPIVRVEGESQFGTLSAGEAFSGMGKVMLGFMDVANVPLEAFAETAFQLTHTMPQNATLFQEGFGATVERHRARGLLAQIGIGIAFDPFVVGKLLKIPMGVTRAVASRYVRQALISTPNLSDAQRADVLEKVLDQVVDTSGYTIDFDLDKWWSPAQQTWVDISDQAAHVREFGVPLIAGGAPIPGERSVNPWTGGRYLRSKLQPIRAPNIRRNIENLGLTDEDLLRIQNEHGRVTINRVKDYARKRDLDMTPEALNRSGEDSLLRNASMDSDAALSGFGDSFVNPFDASYPNPVNPVQPLTATAEVNPPFSRNMAGERPQPASAAGDAGDPNHNVTQRATSRYADMQSKKTPIGTKAKRAIRGFQEAFVDRTAVTNELQDRVAKDLLTETNIWRVKHGMEPMYRLPDSMRAKNAFALNMGGSAASDDASRLTLSKIFNKLGNKFIDRAGDNIDTIVVNEYAGFMHHLDVIRLQKERARLARISKGSQRSVGADTYVRVGMHGMTEFQMTEELARMKREFTPEGWDDTIAKWTQDENFKKQAADQAGEAYKSSEKPLSKWDRLTGASQELFDHYSGLRKMMVSEGLLSQELSDELARNYRHYNPIKYVEGTIMGLAQTTITRPKNRPMLGMTDDVLEELSTKGLDAEQQLPLLLLENATADVYRKAGENRFTSTLIELARRDKSLPEGSVKQVVVLKEKRNVNELLPYQLSSDSVAPAGMKRVARMVNGEREIWQIPADIANQLDLLDPISPGLAERMARMINRPMRMAFTSHNPVFMAANFLHDMMIVVMNEGVLPHEVVTSLAATLSDVWKRDSTLHALIQAGGDVGGLSGKLGEDIKAQYARTAERAKRGETTFKSHADWTDYLRRIAEPLNYVSRAIEMAPRRAVFKKTLAREEAVRPAPGSIRGEFTVQNQAIGDAGYSANVFNPADFAKGETVSIGGRGIDQETSLKAFGRIFDEPKEYSPESVRSAAYAARNATVDFQKYGSAIKIFDALFLYTNAAIQGTLLPARALRKGGYRMGAAPGVPAFSKTPGGMGGLAVRAGQNKAKIGTMAFAAAALTLYAHNAMRYPEAFKNMSLQDKLTRFAVIHGEEEDEYGNMVAQTWSLQPLLREYAAINASIVLAMDKLMGRDSATATQFLTTLVPNINPAGTVVNFGGRDATFGLQTLPTPTTVGQLANDYRTNWDSFRNAPIVSPALASRPVEEQYDAYTTDLAKSAGGFLGMSPKKLDNMMRVGVFRDVFSAIDIGLKKLNPDEPDPEISAWAAELAKELEFTPIRDHGVKKNEFFKGLTSTQRRDIEIVMDAEPAGIPFVSTLQNRFNRESGGQKRRTGVFVASKEYGVSAQETSDMAQILGAYMDRLHDEQLAQDVLYGEGRIDAKQWIEGDKNQGMSYRGAFALATLEHPNAAQAMLDKDGNQRDPRKWSDYKVMVATARGWWGDTRTEGQILAAQKRGIPMPIDADGQPDYHTYFKHVDEFIEDVRDQYGNEGVDKMDRELQSVMTEMQSEHYEEVGMGGDQGLRHYWDIAGNVADRVGGTAGVIYRQFLDANNDERLYLKSRYKGYISSVQRIVNRERENFRRRNPDMDYLYVKWGYAEAGKTPAGVYGARERVARGGQSLLAGTQ